MTLDCYKRHWYVQDKLGGYLVHLRVRTFEVSEFIDTHHWDQALYPTDVLRCTLTRLQRKMCCAIFPTYRGRWSSDWNY